MGDLLAGMPLAPPYFRRMKEVNRAGPEVLGPELPGEVRWSAKQFHERTCERLPDRRHALQGVVRRRPHPRLDQHPLRPQPADLGRLGPALRPADLARPRRIPTTCRGGRDAPDPRRLRRRPRLPGRGHGRLGEPPATRSGRSRRSRSTSSGKRLAAARPGRTSSTSAPTASGTPGTSTGRHPHPRRHAPGPHRRGAAGPARRRHLRLGLSRARSPRRSCKRDGYEDVINVLGGMTAWKAAELPVVNQ